MMKLGGGLRTEVALRLRCTVCERLIKGAQQADDRIEVAMKGLVPYAACPGCGMIALTLMADVDYRRRARVRVYERHGVVWPTDAADVVPRVKRRGVW